MRNHSRRPRAAGRLDQNLGLYARGNSMSCEHLLATCVEPNGLMKLHWHPNGGTSKFDYLVEFALFPFRTLDGKDYW